MTQKIEISYKTIIFTIFFLLSLWLLFQIRHILVIFFFGAILMSALNPLVIKLEKLKIPRIIAALLIYLIIFGFMALILASIIPSLISQTGTLINRLPDYFRYLSFPKINQDFFNNQTNQYLNPLSSFSMGLIRTTLGILNNFLIILTVILVSFYLLMERNHLEEYLVKLFGSPESTRIIRIIEKVEHRLGEWVRAQITLMIILGTLVYIGLTIIGIDFALPLALFSGISEIIPNIGSIFASVPAVLAGLSVSPLSGLAVAALYFLVHQVASQIITPQIMAKEVGVNPLVTVLALITGFKIGGAIGAVLAIPFVILVETLLAEFLTSKKA